jgi:hypothetical protein
MAWQAYKGECEGRGARVSKPCATINKHGALRLSQAVTDECPKVRDVEILYDMDANPPKLGLKFVTEKNGAFTRKLNEGSRSSRGLIMNIRRFARERLGMDLAETRRFPARYDERTRMVVITLEPMAGR